MVNLLNGYQIATAAIIFTVIFTLTDAKVETIGYVR